MKILQNKYFHQFALKTLLRYSATAASTQQVQSSMLQSTVNIQDVVHHSKQKDNWWDPLGEMRVLHSMNPLRVEFVKNGVVNSGFKAANPNRPLEGIKLLDVGCGGGILSEPLARMGADVVGLDASNDLISIAQEHASLDVDISSNLTFLRNTIEDYSKEQKEKFDVVVASEILEHVTDQELFLKSCSKLLKNNGSIFVTTLNRNFVSWLKAIVVYEYLLQSIPLGTHDWNKFITPDETSKLLEKYNCKTKSLHGWGYNVVTNKFSWISSTTVFYALHAVKQDR